MKKYLVVFNLMTDRTLGGVDLSPFTAVAASAAKKSVALQVCTSAKIRQCLH
jgi:hypothetical protein